MKIFFLLNVLIFYLFSTSDLKSAQPNNFDEGVKLYNMNEFDKSKIFFEREIVFNPKHEKSYLYLAKIFKKKENEEEEEINLNNVLLLNPQNDEAIYLLVLLKIKQSDYEKSKELIDQFGLVCKNFCNKSDEIKKKFNKLTP
tara:strand:+ start:479 stop:904 length:426 start_codon:yes stop_codon:yes gene_type:complete